MPKMWVIEDDSVFHVAPKGLFFCMKKKQSHYKYCTTFLFLMLMIIEKIFFCHEVHKRHGYGQQIYKKKSYSGQNWSRCLIKNHVMLN